jgi:hypothetical protein
LLPKVRLAVASDVRWITGKFWARRRFAAIAWSAVVTTCLLFAPTSTIAQTTLRVATSDTLPGFHVGDLPRYLAQQMSRVMLSEWRFEPAAAAASPALDRVEWSFKLSPYAGGEELSFVRPNMAQRIFGAHRPVTVEARLYLNGEYQTTVEQQATIEGGPDDPDLAAAVAQVTRNLLGSQGALRAIDQPQAPSERAR